VNFTPGLNAFQESSGLTQTSMFDNFLTPLVYSWNFNIQYQIARSWVAELGYVGSHGIHQAEVLHVINEPALASPSHPVNGLTTNTVTNAILRVPYLGFSPTGLQYAMTDGSYKFNSLQATLRKQLSYGLTMQVSYTFSRAFSDLLGPNGMNSGDPLNASQQYGLNTAYRPQRLVINYSYNLPGGGLKGFAGEVLGGWIVSGVTVIQDGQPLIITDNRGGSIYGMNLSGNVVSRAQLAPGATYANIPTSGGIEARLGGASGGPGYFNPAAFTTSPVIGADPNTPGTGGTGWGNSGIGTVLGPGQFNFDASIARSIRVGGIHEDSTLLFRAEFFNLFNHPQFSNPATGYNVLGTFGQITSTSVNPRLIQLALKYVF
jgi:hypothetical protein